MNKNTNIIIGFIITVVIGISSGYYITSQLDSKAIDITLCVDVTDKDSARLSGANILSIAIHDNSTSESITVKTQTLSEYHVNTMQEFSLKEQSFLNSNAHRRKREIDKLAKQIDTELNTLYTQQTDRKQSHIFLPILNILNELSEIASVHKKTILIINSDLQENTNEFSCFRKSDLALLRQNNNKAQNTLLQGIKIKDLHNVTVYLVHAPRSLRDDELFNAMSLFYKKVLEEKGAKVFIQSNLSFNH